MDKLKEDIMDQKLYRSRSDKVLAGVCGGIADYCNMDSTIIRLIFVVLIFMGLSILAYIIAWIVIPLEPECIQNKIAKQEATEAPGLGRDAAGENEYEIVEYPAAGAQERAGEKTPLKRESPPAGTAPKRSANFGTGITLIVIGALLLSHRFIAIPLGRIWPVLLILFGIWLIVARD